MACHRAIIEDTDISNLYKLKVFTSYLIPSMFADDTGLTTECAHVAELENTILTWLILMNVLQQIVSV